MMNKKAVKKAKRAELFSVKAYLYKKAQVRALKLQYRAEKRAAKLTGPLTVELPADEHVHGEHCDHEHEVHTLEEQE